MILRSRTAVNKTLEQCCGINNTEPSFAKPKSLQLHLLHLSEEIFCSLDIPHRLFNY